MIGPIIRENRKYILPTVCLSLLVIELMKYFSGGVSGFFFFEHVLGYSLVKARTISAGLSIISALSPLLGAILADSVIGKRNIILFGGWIQILSIILQLIGVSPIFGGWTTLGDDPPMGRVALYFTSLILYDVFDKAMWPSVVSLGADQFDDSIPDEKRQKEAYFPHFYLIVQIGGLLSCVKGQLLVTSEMYGPMFVSILALGTWLFAQSFFTLEAVKFKQISGTFAELVAIPGALGQALFRLASNGFRLEKKESNNMSDSEKEDTTANDLGLQKPTVGQKGQDRPGKTTWLQFAATNYGGSFEPETVEGVYQMTRLVPFYIATILTHIVYDQFSDGTTIIGQQMRGTSGSPGGGIQIDTLSGVLDTFSALVGIFLFHHVIEPLVLKCFHFKISAVHKFMIGTVMSAIGVVSLGLIEMWRKATPVIVEEQYGDPIPINDLSVWIILIPFLFMGMAQFYDEAPPQYKAMSTSLIMVTNTIASAIEVVIIKACQDWTPSNLNDGHMEYYLFLLGALMVPTFFFAWFISNYYLQNGGSYQDVVLAQKKSLFTDGSVDHSTEEETGKEIKDGSQMI